MLSGHSLGGALATLAAHDLQLEFGFGPNLHCYTFGAPRTGNHAFATESGRLVPETWHVINDRAQPFNQTADMQSVYDARCTINAGSLLEQCTDRVLCLPACRGHSHAVWQILVRIQEVAPTSPCRARCPRSPACCHLRDWCCHPRLIRWFAMQVRAQVYHK